MDLLNLQMKVVPDILEVMEKRYRILHNISLTQPVGRRNLAFSLGMTERVLRSETEFLKKQRLIDINMSGMKLNEEGYEFIKNIYPYMKKLYRINVLEKELETKLNITKVIVAAGDSDINEYVKKEMGRIAGQLLLQLVNENNVIALTGGSTLAEVANMLPGNVKLPSLLYVPARGGIGENYESLANTLVSLMAKKTGSSYRLLHVPDQLSNESYNSLMNEKSVQELLKVIKSAKIVIVGIGDALKMAEKRNTSKEIIKYLNEKKAVGETLGNYFSKDGKLVYSMDLIGLRMKDLKDIPHVVAVAGGKSKAAAILSVLKHNSKQILITDEGAAKEILSKL